MEIKKIKGLIIFASCMFIISLPFLFMPPVLHAAYNPLEIINIKPAGTGNPAISPNHRIYRAYPGIEYNIRAAVIGGMYPYKFSLSNAPNGMTINEDTGVISWPNPQTSAQSIRLTVTDAENHVATSTWSISVTKNGFIFIDASHTGTETGTISQPYNSIQDILNLSGRESDIVYFRSGTYSVPVFRPSYYLNIGCNLSYSTNPNPHIWLAYPGENVTLDMDKHYFEVGRDTTPYYFDGLRFYDSYEYGFRSSSAMNYTTFYRCEFDTLTTGRTSNSNQGFYFTSEAGTGNYLVFQDCEFHDYTGVAGIGSLYCQNKMLIEGCHFYNQYQGITDICTAIAAKTSITNSTIRGNNALISEGSVLGHGVNGMFSQREGYSASENNEVCFNLFIHNNGVSHRFNNNGNQGSLYYYRNTCIGTITMVRVDADGYTNGPFIYEKNVIINSNSGLSYHYTCGPNPQNYVTFTNNLTGTPTSRIIDSNGNLTDSYSQYIGTRGWEVGNSDNTDNTPPVSPSGVSIIISD